MKPHLGPVLAGLLALVLVVVTASAYSTANDWAARVDGRDISERDFLDELAAFRENQGLEQFFPGLGQSGEGAVPADLSSVWLSRLIQQELVEQLAAEGGIRVSERHRQQAEAVNIQQFQGEDVWRSFPRWFRDRSLDRDALFLAVVEAVGGIPTEADLRAQYEAIQEELLQACASHILVETLELAADLKAQLDAGADFGELAGERSIDQNSGPQGGDLGCQFRGSYVEPLDSEVFTLPLDTLSDPIETQFGFHLVKVAKREVASFEEVREELAQRAQAAAQERFGRVFLERLEGAEIQINPKYGKFEISLEGPRVVPPVAPDPPDRLPVGGEPEQELPPGAFQPSP